MGTLVNRRGLGWVICAIFVLAALALLLSGWLRQRTLQPVLVLHRPVAFPVFLRDRIQGTIPWRWGWAHRMLDVLLGARKPVNLNAAVFTVASDTATQLEKLTGLPPVPTPKDGPAVWFLESNTLKKLRAQLESAGGNQVCYGRISTADGIAASLFAGMPVLANGLTNQVGLSTSYFAHVNSQASDLFAEVLFSEAVTNLADASGKTLSISIQTNADIAVRLQVPKGKGVFLLQSSAGRVSRPAGFLLEPL